MKSLVSLLFSSGLAMVVGISGAAAGPGGPDPAKEACKDGGWASMEEAPAPFKNQGECVSYFARLLVTATPEVTPTASPTPEATPEATPEPTATPEVTATPSPTPTASATATPSATATAAVQGVSDKDDCKNGGWAKVTAAPGPFKNQGQCVSYFARQGGAQATATPSATASPTATPSATASPTATPSATATP